MRSIRRFKAWLRYVWRGSDEPYREIGRAYFNAEDIVREGPTGERSFRKRDA